ncbi:MAG: hypothetical protein K8M05_06200 [Deltaproteobacteria bacterium]|nr:hypothetical protein [Kofleriaceae bacterium]
MLKWFIRRKLAAFEKTYGYDASYAHELLAADTSAVLAFARIQAMGSYRKGVPKEAWYAAKLVGTLNEDCGPCTQLNVTMALRDGVDGKQLAAVLAGDEATMSSDVALAVRFARAALAHDLEADGYREEIVRRWGAKGLVSLSFGLTVARVYPTIKYALGHGKACARVVVGGTLVTVA